MMFNRIVKRPVVMFIGHKSWVWLGGFVGLVVILGVLGIWGMAGKSQAYISGQSSVPVNAKAEGSSIQFEVETVQPNISGENYFVNYRLTRDQYRQETKAMLAELLNSTVEKTKQQAQENWLELSTKLQKEGEIENILKINGFQDAVADVLPENVTVIVYAQNLTPDEVSVIQDTVVRVTKVRLDKIKIAIKH